MMMRFVVAILTLSLAATGVESVIAAQAQLDPSVRDQVTSAAVGVVSIVDDAQIFGSGTVIAPSGLVLTNFHVVEEADKRNSPVGIFTSDGRSEPRFSFLATVVATDPVTDLALLQVIADSEGVPLPVDRINLPSLTLGDSDQLNLGDDLHIVAFPVIGTGLTYTRGVVSGLRPEPGINGTAWIITDGVTSGGSSGGTATNSEGELVGIPTMGPPLDCRPGDTNGDGVTDATDGCVPTGGAVAYLRPVNLAKPLIESAQQLIAGAGTSSGSGLVAAVAQPPELSPPPADAPPGQRPPAALPARPPLVLSSIVPATLALAPGQNFRVYEGGEETLEQLSAGFANPVMGQQMLSSFGWQEGTYGIFAVDNPPPNAAGWVEIHVHRFATVVGASEALPFLAGERQRALGLSLLPLELFADQSIALTGPAYNGTEATLYARRGSLVFRVTGISPNGDPTNDVIETILIPLVPLATDPRVVTPELIMMLPGPEHLPSGLTQTEERARSASNTADTFANPDETRLLFQEWGWLESASGVYTGTTSNGTTRFEAAVYRWRDEAGASAALSYFVDSRATALNLLEFPMPRVDDETRALMGTVDGGTEATIYMRSGAFLFRFTAIGPGDPMADVRYLLGLP
jgi:S1-C subfamily serine protease